MTRRSTIRLVAALAAALALAGGPVVDAAARAFAPSALVQCCCGLHRGDRPCPCRSCPVRAGRRAPRPYAAFTRCGLRGPRANRVAQSSDLGARRELVLPLPRPVRRARVDRAAPRSRDAAPPPTPPP